MRRGLAGPLGGGLTLALLLALSGCGGADDAKPPTDPDITVLSPAKDGGIAHTHVKLVGDGTTPSAGGYTITDVRMPTEPGPGRLSFRIVDRQGAPLHRYVEDQTKLLHLYVVREDYQDFRHLHPTQSDDGTWSTRVDLAEPGTYRVIAEFEPVGRADQGHVVISKEIVVPGRWTPEQVPDNRTDDDGVVAVTAPETIATGVEQQLVLTVSDGQGDLVNLGSYLGAYAHLTGFDVGTGAFVHAHPLGAPVPSADGSRLTFHVTFHRPGRIRLFVQVRVDGFIHTLAVTTKVVRAESAS